MTNAFLQRVDFEKRLKRIARRISVANLARVLAFAEALEKQQQGKRTGRAQAMAKRTASEEIQH